MIAFILANWKSILAMIATAGLCYLLHALDVNRLEAKERSDLSAQQMTLENKCKADKAITEGVANDYQKKADALTLQFNALVGVQHSRCVAVATAKPAAGNHGKAPGAKLSGQNAGVTSDALFAFARDAEQVRLQLLSCQSFITQTWAEQGQ